MHPGQEDRYMPDEVKPVEEKKFLGLTKTHVSTALLSLMLGAIVPSVLWWLNSKSPSLIYDAGVYAPFAGDKNKLGIFSISVENDGNKMAEDVACTIKLDNATIQEVIVNPSSLNALPIYKGADLTVKVPMLNAGERMQIVVLTNSMEQQPSFKLFNVRGKDVNGTIKNTSPQSIFTLSFLLRLFTLCFTVYFLSRWLGEYLIRKLQRKLAAQLIKAKEELSAAKAAVANPLSPTTADEPKKQLPMD